MKAPTAGLDRLVVSATRISATPAGDSGTGPSDFTYAVLAEPVPSARGGERRAVARRRTRLRSGKVVGADGEFLSECLIANRSTLGGLLRLPKVMPLPGRILLYEDQSGDLIPFTVVWRRGRDVGVRFAPGARGARDGAIAHSMRRKFYAVRG